MEMDMIRNSVCSVPGYEDTQGRYFLIRTTVDYARDINSTMFRQDCTGSRGAAAQGGDRLPAGARCLSPSCTVCFLCVICRSANYVKIPPGTVTGAVCYTTHHQKFIWQTTAYFN